MEIKSDITINDFSAICRLCLKRERRLQSLFHTKNLEQSLKQMIHICFGFEVR